MHSNEKPSKKNCHATRLCFLASLVAATIGCGPGIEMGQVTGKVSLDGKPMAFGTVMMQHVEGGQPSRGAIQPDGSFAMSTFSAEDGARVGTNRVRVTAYSTQDPSRSGGDSGSGALGVLVVPERYSSFGRSGITIDVASGDNPPLSLDLTSRSGNRR